MGDKIRESWQNCCAMNDKSLLGDKGILALNKMERFSKGDVMKKLVSVTAIISAIFALGMKKPEKPALTDEQTVAIQEAVLKTHMEMIKAMEKVEVEKFHEFIIESGEGTLITDGTLTTRQKSLKRMMKSSGGTEKIKYEFSKKIVNVISPDTAILICKGKSTVNRYSGEVFVDEFAISSVFVLKQGKWKIVQGHYSRPNQQ